MLRVLRRNVPERARPRPRGDSVPGAPHANVPLQRARCRSSASLSFPAPFLILLFKPGSLLPPAPPNSPTVRAFCPPLPIRRTEGHLRAPSLRGSGTGDRTWPSGAAPRRVTAIRSDRGGGAWRSEAHGRTARPRSSLAAASAGGAVLRLGHRALPLAAGKSADAGHWRVEVKAVEGRPGRSRAPCSQPCPARCPGAGDARLPPMPATPAGNFAPRSPFPPDCRVGLVPPAPGLVPPAPGSRARVIAGTPRRLCLPRPAARERPPGCATRTPRRTGICWGTELCSSSSSAPSPW